MIGDRPSVITGHVFHPRHSNLRCLPQPVPALIGTGTNDQPVKPSVPAFGISQIGKALPGMDERLLDRVLRLVRVAKDQPRERQEPGTGHQREDLECLVIALLCRFDEIALQRSLRWRGTDVPLDSR